MTKKNLRGLTSLDTLILFIAIVITVAVAAIVLLTTGGALMQKEMSQSAEGRKNVAAGFEVLNVIGTDPSPTGTPHKISNLYIMTRLLPGTVNIPLNTTLLHIAAGNSEQIISFNTSCESECLASTTTKFMVYYLKEGPTHENGYLNMGDVAKITVKLTDRGIMEDEDVSLSLIPAHGPKTLLSMQTPQNMVAKLQTIWPVA